MNEKLKCGHPYIESIRGSEAERHEREYNGSDEFHSGGFMIRNRTSAVKSFCRIDNSIKKQVLMKYTVFIVQQHPKVFK